MSRIDKCIFQEVFPPFSIALGLMTFLVFTRQLGRIVQLLIQKSADFATVITISLSLLPDILVFTLPMSFMIGVLVAFSRLSTESEVVAFYANGISIARLLRPVLQISAAVALATLLLTTFLLPLGNYRLSWIKYNLRLRPAVSQIQARVFNEDFPELVLYIQDISLEQGSWKGVFVSDTSRREEQSIVMSKRGRALVSDDGRTLQLHFQQGTVYKVNHERPEKDTLSRFEFLDVPVRLALEETPPYRSTDTQNKSMATLWADRHSSDRRARLHSATEFQRRFALPIAAVVFGVLGVAMGVRTHRGGRSYGFVTSILVVFTYYALVVAGTSLSDDQTVPVWLGVWFPNLLFLVGGLILLRGVSRESRLADFFLNNALLRAWLEQVRALGAWLSALPSRISVGLFSDQATTIRWRFARVVDLYLARQFIGNLSLTTLAVLTLFNVFTLFGLVDGIIKNQIPLKLVVEYFLYLIPYIIYTVVPFCILLAVLITFAVLDKSGQIVAFKSVGISLYRLVIPVLLLTGLVCVLMFLMQEHILPFANQRQDYLRSVIRGRPVQTYFNPEKKWIFGSDNRLYNYDYYDVQHHIFAKLSIYRIDLANNRLSERIYARRAHWDESSGTWKLEDGWVRDFEKSDNGYITFENAARSDLEAPEYFVKEVKDSNKMDYGELKKYIQLLAQGGFEVDHLLVELHKKISFPFVSLIMALLGIPFAFSMGRHGALYGVAASVLAGIVFWGTFGVFDVLGHSGFLTPFLAAWAPNILYGASGLYLFLTIRT